MGDRRGQSAMLGLILLIGLVIVSATAVLVVGSAALDSVQEQSEWEHDVNEIESISHEVTTVAQSSQPASEMTVQNGYSVSEDEAHVTITVDGNVAYDESIGQLERDGIVYEGGLVIATEDGRVLSPASLDLQNESTLLEFPKLHSRSGSFDGSIAHTETATPIDPPEDRLVLEIESEYYEQWSEQFEATPANVSAYQGNTTTRVVYDLDDGVKQVDSALNVGFDGSPFKLNEMTALEMDSYIDGKYENDQREQAVFKTTADSESNGGPNFDFRGKLISSGDVSHIEGHPQREPTRGAYSNQDVVPPTPTGELMLQGSPGYEEFEGELNGGIYYHNGDLPIESPVTVESESILIVDGDLTIENAVNVAEPIDIFVHGSVTFNGTDGSIHTNEGHRSDMVSLFVHEEDGTEIEARNNPEITGMLYATDATVSIDGELTIFGALVADDIDGHQVDDQLTIHYDENLDDRRTPFATSGGTLEVPERQIVDVANFEEDIRLSGPTGITDDKDGNVRVDGHLTGMEDVEIDGSLLVDGNIQNGVGDAVIKGDLLVTGEPTGELENLDVEGDVRIEGSIANEFEDSDIGGHLVVGGDITSNVEDVSIGGDLRVEGGVFNEIGGVTVNSVLIYGDLTSAFEDTEINEHLVVGGSLSNELEDTTIEDGDLFVGSSLSDGVGDIEVGNNMTVRGDVSNELEDLDIGDNLMIEGHLHSLEDGTIENEILLTDDYHQIDDTDYENIDTDADPDLFPSFEDYLEDHMDEIHLPDLAERHAPEVHYFDVRIPQVEVD